MAHLVVFVFSGFQFPLKFLFLLCYFVIICFICFVLSCCPDEVEVAGREHICVSSCLRIKAKFAIV